MKYILSFEKTKPTIKFNKMNILYPIWLPFSQQTGQRSVVSKVDLTYSCNNNP